jgi:D-apionolactonase
MTKASSPGATVLRAGVLTATLDGPDLTHIRLGATELIRRILVTVRDTNWDTLQPQVLSSTMSVDSDRFEISLEGQHLAACIEFSWHVSIRAEASGRLVYELDGRGGSEFDYARIGLCVLHPVETCAGATYRASSSGTSHAGQLGLNITPQVVDDGVPIALSPAYDALELRPAGGGELSLGFTGDLFEMEDQRNWTDDSFKTYCTPASRGFPHHAASGQPFQQSVEVRADGFDIEVLEPGRPVTVEIGAFSGRSMPALGLAMSSDLQVPGDEDRALRRLGLSHVRADVKVDGALPSSLERAIATCHQTEAALELALHLELSDERRLGEIDRALRAGGVPIARVLAFHRLARSETVTETSSADLVAMVRRILGDLAPVGGGTNMDFAELNRRRPDPAATEIVAWSMNAQVHASDDASVMETVRGQAATVATAREFCGECTFALGPITLKPRFNPAATGPPVAHDPNDLPAHVDPRQTTPFAAAWTAGSIAGLAASGVASLTYFELVGLAGVMRDGTSPAHPKLPAGVDSLFPSYHVLEALAPLRDKPLLNCHVSASRDLSALATYERVVVANLTPTPQTVVISGRQWRQAGRRVELEPYGVSVLDSGAPGG